MIALLAAGLLIQEDSMAGLLTERIPVTNSRSALAKSVLDAAPVNPYAIEYGLFRPRSGSGWIIPLANSDYDNDGWTVYARPVGKTYRLENLFPCGMYLAKSGFFSGQDLVVGGLDGWMGNGPSARAGLLRWDGKRWIQKTWVETDFQAEDCTFRRSGGSWVAVVEGRTYPKHLNVSHAMANVGMRQRFVYSGGRLAASTAMRTMNPMAVLDDLAGAAARGDWAKIRQGCASDALAVRVRRFGRKLSDSHWDIPGNICSTSNRQFISESCDARFDFGLRGGRWVLTRIVPM